ncbi:MAG TPA: hypothetical protein VMD91_11915 [Candidatus Sulfotelmatobacter sp.]|nr:hypothetical protein [Candidatus Sulfotelmatobacter sp.]
MPKTTTADVYALVLTIREASDLQSNRIDGIDRRLGSLETRVGSLETRVASLEMRVERGFDRTDERFDTIDRRFDALTAEMRAGFEDLGRALRRRGPKRDD